MKAKGLTKETIMNLGVYNRKFPKFKVGDTINVSLRIKEGSKERIQHFEGDVIAMHQNGGSTTFTVRKIAANAISVERIFPLYSPKIESIKFIRTGKVRRAKLYYMRKLIGKRARVQERVLTREQKERKAREIEELTKEEPAPVIEPVVEEIKEAAPTVEAAPAEESPAEAPVEEVAPAKEETAEAQEAEKKTEE